MLDMTTTFLFMKYFPGQLFEGNPIVYMLSEIKMWMVFAYTPIVMIVTAGMYFICTKNNLKTEGRAVIIASALMFFSAALGNIVLMVREMMR